MFLLQKQIKNFKVQHPKLITIDISLSEDIISQVLGSEKSGYMPCYNIGPSPLDFVVSKSHCLRSITIEKNLKKINN